MPEPSRHSSTRAYNARDFCRTGFEGTEKSTEGAREYSISRDRRPTRDDPGTCESAIRNPQPRKMVSDQVFERFPAQDLQAGVQNLPVGKKLADRFGGSLTA